MLALRAMLSAPPEDGVAVLEGSFHAADGTTSPVALAESAHAPAFTEPFRTGLQHAPESRQGHAALGLERGVGNSQGLRRLGAALALLGVSPLNAEHDSSPGLRSGSDELHLDESSHDDLTLLLGRAREGLEGAVEQLLPAVYGELHRIAEAHFRGKGPSTLQPTALVHEAYLKLFDDRSLAWRDRAHFFALASRVMRGLLVDHARERAAEKRGGRRQRVTLNEDARSTCGPDLDVLDLNDALDALAELDPRQVRVVEMRCFGGLEIADVAEVLGVSARTVDREWQWAKAWLARRLRDAGEAT